VRLSMSKLSTIYSKTASMALDSYDSSVMEEVEYQLENHYETSVSQQYIDEKSNLFSKEKYVKVTDIISRSLMERISKETINLMDSTARRIDVTIPTTSNSLRKMETINYENISESGTLLPYLYYSKEMRKFLSKVTRHEVYDCPFDSERMTGTRQTKVGDTHGWHWGDHQYALIFIIEAPPIEYGGMLQNVPHTTWDKSNPRVFEILTEMPIYTYYHQTGDIYFFQTDTTLHRTYPLNKDCNRLIINFTYSGPNDLIKGHSHETMGPIYDFK